MIYLTLTPALPRRRAQGRRARVMRTVMCSQRLKFRHRGGHEYRPTRKISTGDTMSR